ncbi:MAG: hypothetical protein WB698_00970 [Solirubrobacteraceae bacterium]
MSAISSPGAGASPAAMEPASQRSLPPVTQVAMATLTLIVAGGIYLAANLPAHVTLAPAIVLLAAAVALLLGNAVMLSQIEPFAWERFFQVARWTLLAYLVVTGMLAFVFIYDGVRGGTLGVLLGMLAVFALDVPLMIAFTVARYADPQG